MPEVIELSEATKVADVIPMRDSGNHAVPGGFYIHEIMTREPWLALDTAEYPRLRQCPCLPSVRITRQGAHIGAVVVHHAFDGRSTGESA